jgi:Flp pilus assembly protein TadG
MSIRRERRTRVCPAATGGQASIEFALASVVFFLIVLGTIDFGRAIFIASDLRNAVREGARVGKIQPSSAAVIRGTVVDFARGTGVTADGVTVTCSGSCATGAELTVSAEVGFRAVAQQLLGIDPITLRARTTVWVE